MVLAAGLGKRLKPLTDSMPKPLIPIIGAQTLIERQIASLAKAGFTRIVINLHHLGEQIQAKLGNGSAYGVDIVYSPEKNLLDTAGGIINALPYLGNAPFAVVSADVVSDIDFSILRDKVEHLNNLGHLILIPNPPYHQGDFFWNATTGALEIFQSADPTNAWGQACTFAGHAVFHPEIFASFPQGSPQALKPVLARAITHHKIDGALHMGAYFDCGTIERLALARTWCQTNLRY